MTAVVCDAYGPPEVLRIANVERPVPADDEVLVRIRATTVNRTDCAFRSGDQLAARLYTGLRRPRWRILGSEFAGERAAVGAAVSEFKVGDRVFGVNAGRFGAHAQLACVRESAALARMPETASFEQAAAVCDGAILALNCLRPARLQEGKSILVYGASGSIGTAAVQLAQCFGAEVTAVCNSTNVEVVRSLGADSVIDYEREDFTAGGERYDVVLDAVGKHSFGRAKVALRPGGAYIATDGWRNLGLALVTRWGRAKHVLFPLPPRYTKDDVVFLAGLLHAGSYRSVIDRIYRLDDVVDAASYVETEQKTGNVVLTVA